MTILHARPPRVAMRTAAAFCFVVALFLCPLATHAREYLAVTGTVQDDTGAAIEGAEVTLHAIPSTPDRMALELEGKAHPPAEARAVTGRDGRFRLEAPRAGFWIVVARAEGRVAFQQRLRPLLPPPPGAPPLPAELAPVSLPPSSELAVRVVDERSAGVSGARVRVSLSRAAGAASRRLATGWSPVERLAVTDALGRATVALEAGDEIRAYARAGTADGSVKLGEAPAGSPMTIVLAPRATRRLRVSRADGSAVEGALLWTFAGPLGRTDAEGWIEVPVPDGRDEHVSAESPEGAQASVVIKPEPGPPDQPLYLTLQPPVELAGRVVERRDRRPVAGALAWDSGDVGGTVHTGPDGGFLLALPAGHAQAELRVAASGFAPARRRVELEDETGSGALTLELTPSAWMLGSVVDAAGRPVAAVRVLAAPPPERERTAAVHYEGAWTGPDGRFLVAGLDPSVAYQVRAFHEDHAPAVAAAAPWTVGPDRRPVPAAEIRLVLVDSRSLTGRVVDGAGSPVAGADVTLLPQDQLGDPNLWVSVQDLSRSTDSEGSFEFHDPLPAPYVLAVVARGYAPRFDPELEVAPDAGVMDLGELVLEPEAVVRGRVVNARGEPVAGADVQEAVASSAALLRDVLFRRLEQQAPALTGADGTFVVDRFGQGEPVRLRVAGDGFAPAEVWAIAGRDGEPVEIELRRVARISGTVKDAEGKPVPGGTVAPDGLHGEAGHFRWVRTDRSGRFEIEDAEPGRLYLRADARGHARSEVMAVDVAPGEHLEGLEITLRKGYTLTGRILDGAGRPVQGAEVWALPGSRVDTTDAEGRFSIEDRPRGPLTLRITREGSPRLEREVDFVPGAGPVEVRLPAEAPR